MYEVMVEDSFSAAHRLEGYEGECENLHGHNFKVQVFVQTKNLNRVGMSMDFRELKDRLKKILKGLDHKCLNELSFFKDKNPSCEELAHFVYEELSRELDGVILYQVKVWESEGTYAGYSGG